MQPANEHQTLGRLVTEHVGGTYRIVVAIIVLVGLFQILTIRDGHGWGDDFARYIQHAKNIVEGEDYGALGGWANKDLGDPKERYCQMLWMKVVRPLGVMGPWKRAYPGDPWV